MKITYTQQEVINLIGLNAQMKGLLNMNKQEASVTIVPVDGKRLEFILEIKEKEYKSGSWKED